MKAWMLQILTIAITMAITIIFGMPLWVMMVIYLPISLVANTYLLGRYNSRASLAPQPIPASGYQDRVKSLENRYAQIYYLNFERIDSFYLQMAPDAIVYIYKHRFEPIFLVSYDLGTTQTYDLITYFEHDRSLVTSGAPSAGLIPRTEGNFLQKIENRPMEYALNEHLKALNYLRYYGMQSVDIPHFMYREHFMESIRKHNRHMKSQMFWPLKIVYWSLTKRGKVHARPLEEQFKLGIAKFPPQQFYASNSQSFLNSSQNQ